MDTLITGLAWYVVFLFSTVMHEAAHAFAAMRGGDLTAYHGGQVSLDPLPHIRREPVGTVLIPLLTFFTSHGTWLLGWASTPYDREWARLYPRRAAWMGLAGPAANLLLSVCAFIVIKIGLATGYFMPPDISFSMSRIAVGATPGLSQTAAMMASIVFGLNLILLVFNLLPLPPLDGSSAVGLVLPEKIARRYHDFMHNPAFGLVGIFIAWMIFSPIFQWVFHIVLRHLYS
jgi:Zn-dependent protease